MSDCGDVKTDVDRDLRVIRSRNVISCDKAWAMYLSNRQEAVCRIWLRQKRRKGKKKKKNSQRLKKSE